MDSTHVNLSFRKLPKLEWDTKNNSAGSDFWPNSDPWLIKGILFLFSYTFGVRRSIDVLDKENQPGSEFSNFLTGSAALGHTEDA